MREQLNFRQKDRWLARDEGRDEGRAEVRTEVRNWIKQMQPEGQITREQLEFFLKHMEEREKEKTQKL